MRKTLLIIILLTSILISGCDDEINEMRRQTEIKTSYKCVNFTVDVEPVLFIETGLITCIPTHQHLKSNLEKVDNSSNEVQSLKWENKSDLYDLNTSIQHISVDSFYGIYFRINKSEYSEFGNLSKREIRLMSCSFLQGMNLQLCKWNEEQCGTFIVNVTLVDRVNDEYYNKVYWKCSDFTGEDECWKVKNTTYCYVKYDIK